MSIIPDQNFTNREKVKFADVNNADELYIGEIVGKITKNVICLYLVECEEYAKKHKSEYHVFAMPHTCLERI